MKVLLIGSGGREHALALALAKSARLTRLFAAPGNPGMADIAQIVTLDVHDSAAVVAFCREAAIDLVVVGPEGPLVAGLVDELAKAGIAAFGPRKSAARLEGSKAFTKQLCAEFGIPTARYQHYRALQPALDYLAQVGAPIVVKADGLAAGKGVVVAETIAEAQAALHALFAGPGAEVVMEEKLEGEEVSFFALCDGKTALAFGAAQDHKRVGEGDIGPNTGGMGAYSPAPRMDAALQRQVMAEIIEPTMQAMAARGTPFSGMLFAGLMLTADGPKLIEFNTRFGDPETQVLMARLEEDLLELLEASARGTLAGRKVAFSKDVALTLVIAAHGYPGTPKANGVIRNLDVAAAGDGVHITQAGTKLVNGQLVASGGRVLNVTAVGKDFRQAAQRAYAAAEKIDFADGFYRKDIGWRVLR